MSYGRQNGGLEAAETNFRPLRLFFARYTKTIYMNERTRKSLGVAGGGLVGLISGFFGGGGGMLCVPLLELYGLDVKRAHATALFAMLPVCIVSSIIYIVNGYFDFTSALCAVIGVVMGGAAGAMLLNKLSGNVTAAIFAAMMIAVGVKLLVP